MAGSRGLAEIKVCRPDDQLRWCKIWKESRAMGIAAFFSLPSARGQQKVGGGICEKPKKAAQRKTRAVSAYDRPMAPRRVIESRAKE